MQLQSITPEQFTTLIAFDDQAMFADNPVPPDHRPPPLTREELQAAWARGAQLSWILADGGERAGYAWLELHPDSVQVMSLVIAARFCGQKLGSRMLEYVDRKVLEHHATHSWLAVEPFNRRALKCYFRHGYRITHCAAAYFGPEHPQTFRFIMEKRHPKASNTEGGNLKVACHDQAALLAASEAGFIGVSLELGAYPQEDAVMFAKR